MFILIVILFYSQSLKSCLLGFVGSFDLHFLSSSSFLATPQVSLAGASTAACACPPRQPSLPHILPVSIIHKTHLTEHPVRPASPSELHLLGGDSRARLLTPNRARPWLGHPQLHPPLPPDHCKPSRCGRSPAATAPCPAGSVTALGDRAGHVHDGVAAGDGMGRARSGAGVPLPGGQPGQVPCGRGGSVSPCRPVAEPAPAPLLGLTGEKYCLCFSNIGLLFCICRFFKDREPPLPRFQRRYPQQCRPRSPPHSKKTNVRPRIDMK